MKIGLIDKHCSTLPSAICGQSSLLFVGCKGNCVVSSLVTLTNKNSGQKESNQVQKLIFEATPSYL